jgi:hypothetical protein
MTTNSPSSIIRGLIELSMKESRDLSHRGVYSARFLSELVQVLIDAHGFSNPMEEQLLKLDNLKAKPDTALLAAGLVSGIREAGQSSKALSNFCNRLVSDVAGNPLGSEKTEMTLVLLAIVAQIYETGELPVAINRVVFAAKQLTSWLEDATDLSPSLSAAICRALNVLLPCMKDVYGSYWENTLQFCTSLWEQAATCDLDECIPFVYASIKLVKCLENISEPNDDLEDALREFAPAKASGLIELLRLDRGVHTGPLEIVNEVLCHEVGKIPVSRIPAPEELFGLVVSESRDIQTAAFNLLHKKIPADQEQKSIDVLLDKSGMFNKHVEYL